MANYTIKRPDILAEDVVTMYRNGFTIDGIARHFECSTRTVWKRLVAAKEPLAPYGATKRYPVKDRDNRLRQQKQWKEKNIERLRITRHAQYEVRKAIKNGLLVRPDVCENCGIPSKYPVQAAHENYHFPLLVRWLCPACHSIFDTDHPKSTRFRPALEAP